MSDFGRRKRSVSLPPRHIVFLQWNDISRSEIIQEALDAKIKAAGFDPQTVTESLLALCEDGKTVDGIVTEFSNCSELLANTPPHNSCN